MTAPDINKASAIGLTVLSLTAFATVLTGALRAMFSATNPFAATDEGTAAHIFMLAIVGLAPVGALFLGTADWSQPARSAKRLVVPAIAVALAFALLYYFEKYLPAHR